ncbi:TonB-dependent receptor [Methylocystis parvus]|uniref:TonB-dependent receptor n=1 Tax=Methylocystis parvus TaxID=134 RepID=UPI003C7837B0
MRWSLAALIIVGCVSSAFAKEATEKKKVAEAKEKDETSQRGADRPSAQTLGRDQSGVVINAPAANTGYSPSFVMRGFPSGVTLFDGAAHGFTSQGVNLSAVDHVEFYKGPSAMLFGKALGGYGGAANYFRKEPKLEIFGEASATSGAFGVNRLTIDLNGPLNQNKNLLFRLTGAAQTTGSFVNFVHGRNFDVAPMVSFDADNGDRWTLRAEHSGDRLVYRDGVPADPIFFHIPREFYAGLPANEHETPISDDVTLTYRHALNKNWKLSAVADYYLLASRWGWFTGWGFNGVQSVVFGNPARTRSAVRSFDAQLRLEGKFNTGFLSHNVFLGLEHWDYFFGYSNAISRFEVAPLNIFFHSYQPGVDYTGALWSNGVARAIGRSIYGQDLVDISENVRLLVGGRYDVLAQRERVFDPFGSLAGEPTASLSKGIQGYFNPRAGVLFRPDDVHELFFAYGQSLIPNTGVRLQGGEAPPPQQDTQYEIGARRRFLDDKMTFELGLFDVTRDNVAIANPANPSGFYSLVTGQQHSHGVEVNLSGEPLPNLKVNATATFLHAVVSKDDNVPSQAGSDLLGAPRRVYNFSTNYNFDSGDLKGLELGLSYYYASRTEATLPNTYGFTLPPQQMLGATLGYSVNDNLKFDVSLTNLTDQPNWTSNGAMFHGEPRAISASVSYKY